jgi:transmembrane sensor
MKDELLIKYLLKETTTAENVEVEEWLASSTENNAYFNQLAKIWETSGELDVPSPINVDAAWVAFQQKVVHVPVEPLKRNFVWLSLASALLIGIGIWGVYSLLGPFGYTKLETASAVITKVLPDGSQLTLNKNTNLTYAKNFKQNRSIHFQKGEIFFNVAHDKAHPFVIGINNINVEVVGTSFNIKHLNAETEVIVETGTVKVTLGKETINLTKNDRILIDQQTKKLQKEQSTDLLYKYYRTKIFDARNTPLHKLVNVLNNAYGSHIVVDDEVKNLTIYIPLEFGSLEQNLAYICKVLKLKISRNQDEIKLSY